ncbi:hypothetical protein TNCV_817021 [Trichonephila clavipes]|nr:hypothetical protein TNCV_817021 [Trichonephila clavipes]
MFNKRDSKIYIHVQQKYNRPVGSLVARASDSRPEGLGGEFDNKDVREILHSNVIAQRQTAHYIPEQNGTSKREMRTAIEMDRIFKYSNPEVRVSLQSSELN